MPMKTWCVPYKGTLTQPIEAGDTLVIAEEAYRVNDVGAEANQTLKDTAIAPSYSESDRKPKCPAKSPWKAKKVPRIMVGDTITFQ